MDLWAPFRRRPAQTEERFGDADRVVALWIEGHDTSTIAGILGLKEAQVYNTLARRPRPRRAP